MTERNKFCLKKSTMIYANERNKIFGKLIFI